MNLFCYSSSINHLYDYYQVPARLKHLYEKHKVLFATQVDSTLKSLGVGLKSMQSHHMASLLIDVESSIKDVDGPSIVFHLTRQETMSAMQTLILSLLIVMKKKSVLKMMMKKKLLLVQKMLLMCRWMMQ